MISAFVLMCMFSWLCLQFDHPDEIIVNECIQTDWLEYDLGEINVGAKAECCLHLKNITTEEVKLEYLIPSCSCVSLTYDSDTIQSLKTMQIHISLDTSKGLVGYVEQGIILGIQGKPNPIYFALKVNIINPICD